MREYSASPQYTVDQHEAMAKVLYPHLKNNSNIVLFQRPQGDEWVPVTASEFVKDVRAVARGLIALGIEEGDRVVLMSSTRYEWTLCDFAIWHAGAITVPVYGSSSGEQINWILSDSEAKIAIFETEKDFATCETLSTISTLQHSVIINADAIAKLMREGERIEDGDVTSRLESLNKDSVASIVYTSGTTGRPKGCVITHENLLSESRGLKSLTIGDVAQEGGRILTFLPLAHVLARAVGLVATEFGCTQAFWSDFKTVIGQFERFQPNTVLGVPRVFEKVHNGVKTQARKKGYLSILVFRWAEDVAIAYSHAIDEGKVPLELRLRRSIFDKVIYRHIRKALGNECRYAISGGGALSPRLGHFFRGVGVTIYEGYGLTESTAAHTVNTPGQIKIGTVGRPIPGNLVHIANDGEIELAGPTVFSGYWKNEEATKDVFRDGRLLTGDLGELDEDGYLRITGRKKEIIITAGGKNVSPAPLEDVIRHNPLVSQAVVIGDALPFVSALITLDEPTLQEWLSGLDRDPETSIEDLIEDPALNAEIQVAINSANELVSHAESIKKFRILPRDLSEEDGELTPTLKVKRPVVNEHFKNEILAIYHPRYRPHHKS